ncbi:MAG: LysR family transcriptional regulator [Xanthobacteraceae bacterium]|nr:MAG: LysR family transcriptional regulator [Xanthobacteraceae bacterium]
MIQIDWNLARAFCATADAGSLSAAARKLGLTQPTLSRQVAALEAGLAVTLFERIGKRLILTPVGLGLLDHARAMAAAADAFALAAAGQSQDLSGGVSISATDAVSVHILPDIVARLRLQVPQLSITVVATDALSDLRRREADIAIRHLRPTEPELIGRFIGDMSAHLYASESWIARHGTPRSATDLGDADILAFDPVDRFRAHLGDWGVPISADQCRITSDNAVVLWEMLRRGLGIGMMLDEVASRMPDLVCLLPDRSAVPVPVWLVAHRELHTSSRIRLAFDIVAEELHRIVVGTARSAGRDEGSLPS